jgi:hypothetical protein
VQSVGSDEITISAAASALLQLLSVLHWIRTCKSEAQILKQEEKESDNNIFQ